MNPPVPPGAYVALATPLTEDRRIHTRDVERLVERAAADGATGVLVAGSTGEGALLEPGQRTELTRVARSVADSLDGSLTVLAGACGPSVTSLDADIAALGEAGAEAVLVLAPSLYPLSTDELVACHLDVAERAPLPTLIYHLPQMTGSALTPDRVGELAAHPRIVGMKDSSRDDDRRLAFIEAAARQEAFSVFTGSAPSLRDALAAGGAGSITAVANVRQRTVTALHVAVAGGDDAEAQRHQDQLTNLSTTLKQADPSTPAVIKAALQLDGVIEERWCVPPLRSLPPSRLDRVRTALLR